MRSVVLDWPRVQWLSIKVLHRLCFSTRLTARDFIWMLYYMSIIYLTNLLCISYPYMNWHIFVRSLDQQWRICILCDCHIHSERADRFFIYHAVFISLIFFSFGQPSHHPNLSTLIVTIPIWQLDTDSIYRSYRWNAVNEIKENVTWQLMAFPKEDIIQSWKREGVQG